MTTTDTAAPVAPLAVGWAKVHRLALDLAERATGSAGLVEVRYRAIADARAAMYAAERAHEEAQAQLVEDARGPLELARALAWRGVNIAAQPLGMGSGGGSTEYRAAFAGGRVTSQPMDRSAAPKGRAYGWRIVGDHRDNSASFDYEPAAGTRNPDKLARQVDDATANLRAWLSGFTAETWLSAHGIDPATAPELVNVAALAVDVQARYDDARGWWHRPRWSLTVGGSIVSTIDDVRDIFGGRYEDAPPIPGNASRGRGETFQPREDDEAEVRRFAADLAEKARAAMIARLGYEPREV